MLNLIVLAIIFRALWSTDCYAHLVWDHLSRVETTFPRNGDGLVPTTRYHVIPGSQGMFVDVAEEIRSRMEGIARDRFIVVFDFGGVSPKYFSIIEELTGDASVNGKTKAVRHKNVGRGILEDAAVASNHFSTIEGLNSGEASTDGMARPPNEEVTTEDALVKQEDAGRSIHNHVSEPEDPPKYSSTILELTPPPEASSKDEIVAQRAYNVTPTREDTVVKWVANASLGDVSVHGEAPEKIENVKIPLGELMDASSMDETVAQRANNVTPTNEDAVVERVANASRSDASAHGEAPEKLEDVTIPLGKLIDASSMDELGAPRANNVTPTNEDAVVKRVANASRGDASAHEEAAEKIENVTIPLGELMDASSAIPYIMSNATVTNPNNDEKISPTIEDTTKCAQRTATELSKSNSTEISNTGIKLLQPTISQQSSDHKSMTDQPTNETVNFTSLKQPLSPEDSIALRTSLKSSTDQISLIIKKLGFNCVSFKPKALDVNVFIVDSMVLGEGTVCGLDTMKPSNNITVTKNESTIEVTIPLVFTNLTVKSKSIDVKKLFISIVTGLPIEASIKEIIYNGNFVFEKGTPLKLKDVHLKWGNINGIHLKALADQGLISGIVDYIGEVLRGAVTSFISPIFDEIEKELRKTLLGTGIM